MAPQFEISLMAKRDKYGNQFFCGSVDQPLLINVEQAVFFLYPAEPDDDGRDMFKLVIGKKRSFEEREKFRSRRNQED